MTTQQNEEISLYYTTTITTTDMKADVVQD